MKHNGSLLGFSSKQTGVIHILLILIVVIVGVIGVFYYIKNNQKAEAVAPISSQDVAQNANFVEVIPDTPAPESKTATYRNLKYGYSFDYLRDYHVYISEPDYVFVKKTKEDKNVVFDIGIKHEYELYYPNTAHYETKIANFKNTSFEEYASKVVYVDCALIDVAQEYYCDRIVSQEPYVNMNGITGYKFTLNLVHASRDRNSKRETLAESTWGPVYILDITGKGFADVRGLSFKPAVALNLDSSIGIEIDKVVDSVKF